ncbi:MAG: hypothetical protein ACKOTH_03645 [Solirubrobacterales bacterium]
MKRSIIAAFTAAFAMTSVLATVGLAKSGTGSSKRSGQKTQQSQQSGPPQTMAEALAAEKKEHAARDAALAEKLGVSTSDLTDAQKAIRKENLDKAVAENRLTEAQRDAIVACEPDPLTCDRSNLPAGPRGGRGGPGHAGGPGREGAPQQFASQLAAKLNLDEAKVAAALKETMPRRPKGERGQRDGQGPRGAGGPGGPPPMIG